MIGILIAPTWQKNATLCVPRPRACACPPACTRRAGGRVAQLRSMQWLLLYAMAALADSVCNDALLASLCARNPTSTSCRVCVSRHQHDLRLAGCTAMDVNLYCDRDGVAVFGWNATAMA